FNAKIKALRSQFRGIQNIAFFIFRIGNTIWLIHNVNPPEISSVAIDVVFVRNYIKNIRLSHDSPILLNLKNLIL
ncbi:MAG: hypothetical protein RR061_05150, partial [Muribaculaceae bacterium]